MESFWQVSLKEEYDRDNKLKYTEIEIIQEWISKQPHLPKLSDHQIVLFLTACKYSLEKTKETIDLNYTMRTRIPELFSARNVNSKWAAITMSHMFCGMMPRDPNGNAVLVYKLQPMELSKWNLEEYGKLSLMVQDISNLKYGAVPGYIFVQDMEHFTFGQMLQMSVSTLSNILKFAQEASSCAINSIHFVNAGAIMEKLFSLMNPFLNEDVKQVIKIHPNYESLRAAVDPSVLPSDYGGSNPTLEKCHEETINALKKLQPWFDDEAKQRVDENKRSNNKAKDYGIQGSFRKIDID